MPETRLAVYVTAQTVNSLATGAISYDEVRKQLDLLGIEKVYLENYRTGLLVPQTHLAKVREAFKDSYEVSGGSCIGTWGEDWGRHADFGFRVVCLTDQKNLSLIAKAMKEAGEIFDEVLIDDFWANWCVCPYCVAEFNREYGLSISDEMLQQALTRGDNQLSRLWARFSTELFSNVSRRYVVKPFKESGGQRIVDKVPEWREDFYIRGLFIPIISRIFDGIYVGTESREGTRRYGAFFTARMVRELAGGIAGVWFDTYNGLFSWWEPLTVETYLEQLFESMAALPPEVTLFCLEDLLHSSRHQLVEAIKQNWASLRRAVVEVQGEPIGVLKPSIQPGFSPVDDRYVEDYIGMIGVPLVPVNPDSMPAGSCVLITAKEVATLDLESLSSKARAILLTSGAVRWLMNENSSGLGYRFLGAKGPENLVYECFHATSLKYKGQTVYEGHRRSVLHPVGPIIDSEDTEVILTASDGYEEWPVIFRKRYGKADVISICVTDYPALLCEYPEVVRQAIRDLIYEYIGVSVDIPHKLRSYGLTPQLVNFVLHVYNDGHIGVANYNYYGIPLELTLDFLPRFADQPKLLAGSVLIEEAVDRRITMRVPARSHGFIKATSAN